MADVSFEVKMDSVLVVDTVLVGGEYFRAMRAGEGVPHRFVGIPLVVPHGVAAEEAQLANLANVFVVMSVHVAEEGFERSSARLAKGAGVARLVKLERDKKVAVVHFLPVIRTQVVDELAYGVKL